MQRLTPNLVVAAIGPLAELLGLLVLIGLFTLLRGQAERRPYFRSWEQSWVMLAVALTAGVLHQRATDPNGVLQATGAFAPWLLAAVYFGFRLLAVALMVHGTRLFVVGGRERWFVNGALPLGVLLSFLVDTRHTSLPAFVLADGAFVALAYGYAATLLSRLPRSRRSAGTALATLLFTALAAHRAGLLFFHYDQARGSGIAGISWAVRFERYGFYIDLLLQLALAYSMVRLLLEDGATESADTRAQMDLMRDRERHGDRYDEQTGLLHRRAFEAAVGLDFAKAGFGSVVMVRLANLESVTAAHGAAVGEAMLRHVAGLIAAAVRPFDRVYRWGADEFLVVIARAVPQVAEERMRVLLARAAPLAAADVHDTVRAETTTSAAYFSGEEDLGAAVQSVAARAGIAMETHA
jgi:diguanylate cyclase (GGDEF)-like protein